MTATILLLGARGQVGHELGRSLPTVGRVLAYDHPDVDFARPESLREVVRRAAPDVIVNAAAYTAVDRAEHEPDLVHRINAAAVAELAAAARDRDALLVHYSTDYVFDGGKDGWYVEGDEPRPLGVYGATKLAGERAAAAAGRHLVFRTSWVYAAHGQNFIRTMLRLARERETIDVVDDQWGAPTGAALLADVTALAIDRSRRVDGGLAPGLYHLVAGGETTWCRLARFVLAEARRLGLPLAAGPDAVRAIPTSAYPTPARRPANSRLATEKIRAALGIDLPAWQDGVAAVVAALVAEAAGDARRPSQEQP
jgi:dTDP-4-dehydrorhamnose reductase